MTASSKFVALYDNYRVNPSLRENYRRTLRAARWRIWMFAAAAALFAAATVAESLAASKITAMIGGVLAAAFAVAGLALITGIVMSASDTTERTSAANEEVGAVERVYATRPAADASERDVADWMRRVEGALGHADPGPDPPVAS